mmetsp:Transcript_46743/g.91975  ORF Transcript_46743/g.91975 Transcript_46743/m.91975 type:complete len:733 (+) Transcript_46743:31-2229(+)
MSGFDDERVTSASLDLRQDDEFSVVEDEEADVATETKFRQFLRMHRDEHGDQAYRDQLQAHYKQGDNYLIVDADDLRQWDQTLMDKVMDKPAQVMPLFENAAKHVLLQLTLPRKEIGELPHIQVQLKNFPLFTDIRHLSSKNVSRLVCVRGIVVNAGRTRIKATLLNLMCRNCKVTKRIPCSKGFGLVRMPRTCDTVYNPGLGMAKCPVDPYQILADSSEYIDQQRLKLQENPEDVPTGEMPRHITLAAERYLVEAVKPGTRVTVVGIYTTYEAKQNNNKEVNDVGIRIPYIRILGIQQENEANDMMQGKFNPEDEEEMINISKMPNLYQSIAESMAPAIMGSDNIKKAVACQLFGGGRKHLPDGMRLRGDINVLLLGDPSVAKSQFLKFAVQAAPVGVYTSGKGSSAAGLTASVIRDPGSGEFHLEGGALVLADGGLVCIDEFDKMKEQDRVAIHEAMEQQTISIAKAGISTILNSRTSVLAAANPTFGRYDDMKTAAENIDFQTTILSRFDLIFIVRDIQDPVSDGVLARHIINVHKYRDAAVQDKAEGSIPIDKLKRYIAFARARVTPRISAEAAEVLKTRYVTMRNAMREKAKTEKGQAIPLTVRQLEAIVRISEALAKMELAEFANEDHVKEALRLFKVSTFSAATSGGGEAVNSAEFQANVKNAENFLTTRIAVGNKISKQQVLNEMTSSAHNFGRLCAIRAIEIQVNRGKLKYKNQGKLLTRIAV